MKRTEIEKMFKTNGKKKSIFLNWYINSKDKTEEDFNKCIKGTVQSTYNTCMDWLKTDEETQEVLKECIKSKRSILMLDIYNAMYQKALKGDTKSAEWVEKFFKSDFFENSSSEIDDFLTGIEIEGLK